MRARFVRARVVNLHGVCSRLAMREYYCWPVFVHGSFRHHHKVRRYGS